MYTRGSADVTIGIVDHGVTNEHPDLDGKVSGDSNFFEDYHGFEGAGVAAANTDNVIGIAGVCWGCLINAQASDLRDDEDIYHAIMDAAYAGADVINMSFSREIPSGPVASACANVYRMHRTLVASCDNEALVGATFPAAHACVIGVASVTEYAQPYGAGYGYLVSVARSPV